MESAIERLSVGIVEQPAERARVDVADLLSELPKRQVVIETDLIQLFDFCDQGSITPWSICVLTVLSIPERKYLRTHDSPVNH